MDLPTPVELEFRDGIRTVPPYLAPFMSQLETHRLTYEEAIAQVNRQIESNYLNAHQDKLLKAHFKGMR